MMATPMTAAEIPGPRRGPGCPLSRAAFARLRLRDAAGNPWLVRDYQRESLESRALRKVHCDGRDVGKTAEIELVTCWAALALPNMEMLIATQCENHLFPLMNRLARRFTGAHPLMPRLTEMRRSPSWHFRFDNGFTLWGRIAGPGGVNFQGMHVHWQLVDEAQEMGETAWGELYQALNGGGSRWVYGVPNGLRNTFHRMTGDAGAEQHRWPSSRNPDFTPEKDGELARLYGGRRSPGYIHRVLGEHGAPAHGVFDIEDYLACVDPALECPDITLRGGEPPSDPPAPRLPGRHYLGCDLGYTRDPSEFVVYRDDPPHLENVLRLRLEGVNYARQADLIAALDRAWGFRMIVLDAGGNGSAVAHQLMALGPGWCARVRAVPFGSVIDAAPLPDGTRARRRAKEFMTALLRRRMAERTLRLPALPDREEQYSGHTCTLGANGLVVYAKGNDHLIDADRCALYAHYLDTAEEGTPACLGLPLLAF